VSSDWAGKNVLDFGGNIGNLLRDRNCTIDPERLLVSRCRRGVDRNGPGGVSRSRTGSFTIAIVFFFNPDGARDSRVAAA
jgi:hypothetical protein